MMPADNRLQVPRKLDVGDELEPPQRVHSHELQLFGGQGAGLVQDLVRQLDLPDVVQVGADANRGLLDVI